MFRSIALQRRLAQSTPLSFLITAGTTAFLAYACVYAFRKPFTAASFSGLEIWGVQYKIALVIAQVAGYALSKFLGIRIISGLKPAQRSRALLCLIGTALVSLLGFALSPPSWGIFWLFLNGLPLGMGWGVIFSYLEGRRLTDALAAMLCANFVLSSGFVKTVGKWLMLYGGISPFWMPFIAGLIFLPLLLICIWILEHLPPPSVADELARTPRKAMSKTERKLLFWKYAPGLILLVGIYLGLTIVRDIRDNFAVEIWAELGMGDNPAILTTAELPIAAAVLLVVAALSWVKSNFRALWVYHAIIAGGAIMLIAATILFQAHLLSPVSWMILSGAGAMLPYILFNGVIFDRLLGAFKEPGNVGFLMYIADAVGYLGSVVVMLWRNFGEAQMSWLNFFSKLCITGGILILFLTFLSLYYLKSRSKAVIEKAA